MVTFPLPSPAAAVFPSPDAPAFEEAHPVMAHADMAAQVKSAIIFLFIIILLYTMFSLCLSCFSTISHMLQACMFNLYSPIIQYRRVFSQFAINAGGILSCFSELYYHSGMVLSCYEAVFPLFYVQKGRTENICLLSALPGLLSAIYVFPIMFRTLFHII